MAESVSNTKRIFKNTIVLYVRMIVVTVIALYTSRLILQALGVSDFGLYHVVGGVVGLLTFFNDTMSKTTSRFLNYAMVREEYSLGGVFSTSITIHLLVALIFLFVGETVGLWFLNAKIQIPEGREFAANIVYQSTVFSFCLSILSIPYRAAVVAYEKMSFIAIVSIVEALLKLGIAFILLNCSSDRLAFYGILLFVVAIFNFFAYQLYCRRRNDELRFRLSFNKERFKEIFSFVGWALLGQFAVAGCNQGNVIMVNMFHSVVANAAMSVGNQINHAISHLTSNFQTAFNPQITKSYASGDFGYVKSLSFMTSKISFCILYVVMLPVAFNIDWILDIWLDEVPPLSNVFAVLFFINGIINALSSSLHFVALAAKDIKNFQIATAIVFIIDIPIVYLLYSLGFPPATVMWVKIGVITAILFVRLYYASKAVPSIDIKSFVKEVLLPMLLVVTLTIGLCFAFNKFIDSTGSRILFTVPLEIVCVLLIWIVCLNKNERNSLITLIRGKRA